MRRRAFLGAVAGAAAQGQVKKGAGAKAAAVPVRGRDLTAIHVMVDMPEWVKDNGRRFDPKKFIGMCLDAQVEIVELKCKNAVGDAMFPFRERQCPRDWVTETCALAKEAGLQFVAYYNVGLDNIMAKRRPEWRSVDAKGEEKIAFGAYNWMCIRGPWREMVIDEVRQLQEALRPHGMWFDLLGMPNAYGIGSFDPAQACFCPHCREAYRKRFGEEQPVASADPEVRFRANRFGHEGRCQMFRDLSDMLLQIDPKLVLGYNGAGNYDMLNGTPEDLQRRVGFNSSEAKQHRLISYTAKVMWSLGKRFQIHTFGGFMRMQPGAVVGTWAAWNLIPSTYLDVSAAITSAHAGRTCIGVNPLPDGTVYEAEFANIGATVKEIRRRERHLAGLESVPSVGIVFDAPSELTMLQMPGQGSGWPVRTEATGLHNALADAGIHFDVVPSHVLRPERYRALLVANAVAPRPELTAAIEKFVENGGLLIATNETSLRTERGERRSDFAWSKLLGVSFKGVSPYKEANYGWLSDELRGAAPAYPVLFLGPVLEVTPGTARPLAELVYPGAHRTRHVFTDGETPYTHFDRFTGLPLITANRVGKGTVLYIAAPIGAEIAGRDDTWLKRVVAHAVKKYATGLAIDAEVPPGVQVVFGRRGRTHVVSLVNHYAGMVTGAERGSHPRVGPVKLRVPLEALGGKVRTASGVDLRGFRWSAASGALEAEAETIGHHSLVVIET